MGCILTNFSGVCLGLAVIIQSITFSRNLRLIREREEIFSRQILELQQQMMKKPKC